MNEHTGAPTLPDSPGQLQSSAEHAGTLLGCYTTAEGRRRHIRLVGTAESGLCIIDAADEGAVLVEPELEELAEARAIAADYLELASERGEPQSRHPWSQDDDAPNRSRS